MEKSNVNAFIALIVLRENRLRIHLRTHTDDKQFY